MILQHRQFLHLAADAAVLVAVSRPTRAQGYPALNREINAGLADPKIGARLADMGGAVLTGSPANFGKLIAEETEKWAKVIRFAGIKPE